MAKKEERNPLEAINGLFLKRAKVPFKMTGKREEKKRLIDMINTVAESSPFAKEVLTKAAESGYTLSLEFQHGSVGNTNGAEKTITLQPTASNEKLMSTLIHECRHAGQIENGVNAEFFSLNVKSELMVRRAMEADACAAAAYGVMQMKANGQSAAYDEYKSSDSPLFDALETAQKTDSSEKNMLRTGFDCWYQNTNTKAAYENVYLANPMKRATYDMFFFNMDFGKDVKSAEVIDKICATKDGGYFADKNALEDGKYLDISEKTKEIADKFFEEREYMQYKKPDKSYQELPVRKATLSESFTMLINGFSRLEKTEAAKEKILENKKQFLQSRPVKKSPVRVAALKKQNSR